MEHNPYAPPQAVVDEAGRSAQAAPAPALWNPNAAAAWSLLLTPAFGAFLHMKNWQALGEPEKAEASRKWVIGVIVAMFVLTIIAVLLPESKGMDSALRGGGIGLLVGWYISSAKAQVALVLARHGKAYPRRGWLVPLLLGLAAIVGFVVALGVLGGVLGMMGWAA